MTFLLTLDVSRCAVKPHPFRGWVAWALSASDHTLYCVCRTTGLGELAMPSHFPVSVLPSHHAIKIRNK